MKKFSAIILSTILALSMTGCAMSVSAEDLMSGITANEVKTDIGLSDNAGIMDFATELFKNSENGENTLVSPFSVMCALAMTANGADGETLSQMEETLGMSADKLNAYIHKYAETLPQSEKEKLSVANSIWFAEGKGFTPNADFLQLNADYYGASVYRAKFDNSTVRDINTWVNLKTDGMIKEILDGLSPDAVMCLVNALAFDAEWERKYEKGDVADAQFTKSDNTTQTVEMMYGNEGTYLEDESAKGFLKYYSDGGYAFAALLPNEGISVSDYVQSLTGEKLKALLDGKQNCPVDTGLPKFKCECSYEMNEILEQMGMTDAFRADKADFSRLGTFSDGKIYIGSVLHKTFIEVAEKGTRAGAATAVIMNGESAAAPAEAKEVILDRPFVYMIIDANANLPLFIGTVTEVK